MVSPSPSYGVTISNVKVNGAGDTVTVHPGAALNVTLSYSIVDTACPGCIDQIQVGFSAQKPFTCVYNGIPGASGKSGTASFTTAAPSAPGTYYLAFDRSQAYSCPTDWWNGAPPAQRYFAQINVQAEATPPPRSQEQLQKRSQEQLQKRSQEAAAKRPQEEEAQKKIGG